MTPIQTHPFHLLNIGDLVTHGEWNWSDINSPFFRIYLVREGQATLRMNGTDHALIPEHLYLIPPFTLHSDLSDGLFGHCYLHILEESHGVISPFDRYRFPVGIPATPLDTMLIGRLLDLHPGIALKHLDPKRYDGPLNLNRSLADLGHQTTSDQLETMSIVNQLYSHFLAKAELAIPSEDKRILRSLQLIQQQLDKPIRIADLSASCFMSEFHFIRLFKREIGVTPIQYINQKKIERAQQRIVAYDDSVKDVASSLSFDNISYFNKLFLKLTGKTPTQYKKEMR